VRDVGNIGSEFPEWNIGSELTIQYIRRCPMLLGSFLYESVRILSTNHREKTIFLHEPVYFLVIYDVSFLSKLHSDDSISVFFVEFQDELFYFLYVFFLSIFLYNPQRN